MLVDWDRSLMLVVACLMCVYSLMPILAHGYLLVILLWSPYVDSLLFCKSWLGDGYNCSNTCLYALWSTLMLILMHSISFFSWFSPVQPQNWWRLFLGLGLKTKWASVCRLCHKTNRVRSARDTHWDLAAYFMWKQVWLGFPSLAWRLAEARRRVVHMAPSRRLRRRQVEDGWVNTTGYVGPCYPTFAVSNVLGPRGIVVI
jgi:hypothetical protein